jgi:hypothetical protein
MKKSLLLVAVVIASALSSVQAAGGGVAPCLATCFLGDSRIGLYMNEGKPIETADWIVFGGNAAGGILGNVSSYLDLPFGSIYGGYDAYQKSKTAKGFCVGAIWGRRAGAEINTTKLRTKEILMCIPIVDLYPCIAIPLEAYNGKTMSQVIQEEGLTR